MAQRAVAQRSHPATDIPQIGAVAAWTGASVVDIEAHIRAPAQHAYQFGKPIVRRVKLVANQRSSAMHKRSIRGNFTVKCEIDKAVVCLLQVIIADKARAIPVIAKAMDNHFAGCQTKMDNMCRTARTTKRELAKIANA